MRRAQERASHPECRRVLGHLLQAQRLLPQALLAVGAHSMRVRVLRAHHPEHSRVPQVRRDHEHTRHKRAKVRVPRHHGMQRQSVFDRLRRHVVSRGERVQLAHQYLYAADVREEDHWHVLEPGAARQHEQHQRLSHLVRL